MQTKKASFMEALVGTFVGFIIAFFAQMFLYWLYDVKVSASVNASIVIWMTLLSVLRSYVLRRLWNREWWKRFTRVV